MGEARLPDNHVHHRDDALLLIDFINRGERINDEDAPVGVTGFAGMTWMNCQDFVDLMRGGGNDGASCGIGWHPGACNSIHGSINPFHVEH